LSSFIRAAATLGARTHVVDVCRRNIEPCKELIVCERKGFCPIDDDMKHEVYGLLREADVVVAASPIYFYNCTAQLKALIDRCQTLWARKYKLKLTDPGRGVRKGFVLSVAATRGKNLFEGLNLTMQYFFDAIGASFEGSLTYRGIEGRGEMDQHPTVDEDVRQAAASLLEPLAARKKVLFLCRENACRSQMAGAFARHLAGDRLDVVTAGSRPAVAINSSMAEAMAEKGIDLAFLKPRAVSEALREVTPEVIVTMGCEEECPVVPGASRWDWELPDPAGQSMAFMRAVRDEVETKVRDLLDRLI
jgi:multimeric flavodoxin WrbA/protein-tyrosine-phosphatase